MISKLRDASGDHVALTVQYMSDMAPYLRSTTSTIRSSQSTSASAAAAASLPSAMPTSFTLPTSSSIRVRRQRQQQNRMSAEYPSGYHRPSRQQQRLSVMLSHQEQVRQKTKRNHCTVR